MLNLKTNQIHKLTIMTASITTLIQKLPYELREHIVSLDLDLAVICNCNKKIIKKLIHHYDLEILIKKHNVYTIEYILDNFYNHFEIDSEEVLDFAIYTFDLDKIKLIDKLIPISICTIDTYKYIVEQSMHTVEEWINLNRPVKFMNRRIKKPRCEKISDQDFIRLPIDVQIRYKQKLIPCSCKRCGGDGIGYV